MTLRGTRLIYIAFVTAVIAGAILLRYQDPFFVRALRLIAFDHFQRLDPPKYDPNVPIRIVAFDVLFAEPDRTSLEAVVKQLPASEAAAVTAAMTGRPSNDQQFADEIRQTPTVLSIVLGQGTATTLPAKAGFRS